MAQRLEQVSQWHEMYCHDLEVMSSSPDQAELGVHGTSVLSRTWTKHKMYASVKLSILMQYLKKMVIVEIKSLSSTLGGVPTQDLWVTRQTP